MCIYHIVCYCYALLWAISEVLIRIRVTLNFFPHNSLKFRHRARGRLRKNFHILIFEFNFALTHTYSISYIANTWAKIKGTSTWHTKMISVPSKMVAYCYRENLSYFLGFIPVYFFQNTYVKKILPVGFGKAIHLSCNKTSSTATSRWNILM